MEGTTMAWLLKCVPHGKSRLRNRIVKTQARRSNSRPTNRAAERERINKRQAAYYAAHKPEIARYRAAHREAKVLRPKSEEKMRRHAPQLR